MLKKLVVFFLLVLVFFAFTPNTTYAAVSFTLIPPSGQLSRGQEVTFTINIDTGGASVTSIQTGMTYVTTALEYISVNPGAAMDGIVADTSQGAGRVLFTGTKAAGFTGNDAFATVVFKIIAAESGETELCTLWQPETTEDPTPAPVCNGSCTTSSDCPSSLYCSIPEGATTGYCRMQTCPEQTSCVCPQVIPTSPPIPTALPTMGFDATKNAGTLAGIIFLIAAGGIIFYSKKNVYVHKASKHHKPHHS